MAKLILLSLIIFSVVLPMMMAARPKPQATLRQVVLIMVFVIVVWSQLCLRVYPQYVQIQ
jgi:hypothetical protein